MNRFYRLIARLLIVATAWVSFPAHAAMVGTDQVTGSQARADLASVSGFLRRADVVAQLEALGVSPASARDRVSGLTQDELSTLAGKINSAPAGATESWLWAIIIVGVVIYLIYFKR